MAILMELLWNSLGTRIRVLGGDTDSVKVSCDEDISDEDIEGAMQPLGDAAKRAIDTCMARLRKNFPELASTLKGIGSFEIENRAHHYPLHYEMWNKARCSFDGQRTHITCAGLPRPIGQYTIETFMDDLIGAGYEPGDVLSKTLGFDTFVAHGISHTLEHHKPNPTDIYDGEVTDYQGNTEHVCCHQSTALYPAPRWLGETLKLTNRLSVEYLERKYGRVTQAGTRYLEVAPGNIPLLSVDTADGIKTIMRGQK